METSGSVPQPCAEGQPHEEIDATEYAALFAECRERLWNLLRFHLSSQVGARVDPDDLLQEVYIAAWQRFSAYSPAAFPSFFLWIRIVALQTLQNMHRFHYAQKRTVVRERSVDFWDQAAHMNEEFMASITSPSQRAMRNEMLAKVQQAIESLSPNDREVITLRHFEELTNIEMASLLNLSEQAVSLRYIRAIDRLRRKIAEIRAELPTSPGQMASMDLPGDSHPLR